MDNQNIDYNWQDIDQVIRKWIVMSNFQKDQDAYQCRKEENDEKIVLGYN
jgi:hypothetical protein